MSIHEIEDFCDKNYQDHHSIDRKIQRQIRRKHAQNSRRPKKTSVVQVPTVSKQATVISEEDREKLVSVLRLRHDRQLANEENEGGRLVNEVNDPPTLGKLFVKLVQLKVAFLSHAIAARSIADTTPSSAKYARESGKAIAYDDAATRLDQLIESASAQTPKGTT